MIQLKYLHSQLTAESVQQLIALHYSFAEIVSCKFYDRGLHDNYLVENKSSRFILRIYRNEWRSPNKVMFELELLDYLRQQDCPVAAPLPTTEGKLGVTISCPEGDRILALFEYAEGFPPDINDLERISNELGKTVAKVHAATTGFSTHYTRPTLDTSYLLDHSLKVIEPYLDKDKKKYLDNLQQKIHAKIPIISQEENTLASARVILISGIFILIKKIKSPFLILTNVVLASGRLKSASSLHQFMEFHTKKNTWQLL